MAHRGATRIAEQARQSASAGDWDAAFQQLVDLDADGSLSPEDLPLLAEVAYAAGHLEVTLATWERVHAASLALGDGTAAAGAAARVAMHLLFDTALMAPVRGWLNRAERLLDGRTDAPAYAWYSVVRAYERLLSGDYDAARPWAVQAVEAGSRVDPAAGAIGQVATARLLLLEGDVDAGLSLLEDVGVATMSGDLDPLSTGVVYCELVCALQGAAQYDLAEQWTEVMERWCESNAIGSLRGRCRVHRAEILRLRGRCHEAEEEVSAACDELRPYLRRELGWPLSELGEIRLRRGDVTGAERALSAALDVGWDPQPGLALVHLARANVTTAAEMIRDALDRPVLVPSKERPPHSGLRRAPLLAAQVEIEIAAGETDRARVAAVELGQIADRFRSRALAAASKLADGRVQLACGDHTEARAHLEEALQRWGEIGAPYEMARTRRDLAELYVLLGRPHHAQLELEASGALLQEIAQDRDHRGQDIDQTTDENHSASRLVCEGEYWAISFGGDTMRIRDLKGIRYLAHLLSHPGREFHALDLVAAERGRTIDIDRGGSPVASEDNAGAMLDEEAKAAYKRRLDEIDADIEEARVAGDGGRASQAEAERAFLVRELSRAFGLGGRSRRAGSTSERARVAVTRALRTAIRRISGHHPVLGEHLDHAVRTGTYCSYGTEPGGTVRWKLGRRA